jgi:hypothetical protein
MRRLVWVHAGRKRTMLVFSWRGSYFHKIRDIRFYCNISGAGEYYEEDENFMDQAIDGQVFSFLHKSVVSVEKLHKEVSIVSVYM